MQPFWAEDTTFKTFEYITDPNLNTIGEDLSDYFCWQQQIYKWFSLRIWEDVCRTCHMPLKKTNKNITEQMTSNSVLAQIFLVLWTFNTGAACNAVWIHAIRAFIWKHNILQFIY